MARLFTGSGIATTTLRRIAGIRARRPSAFAACIGATLRGQTHPPAPPGAGGRRNVGWQQRFTQANAQCRGQASGVRARRQS